MYVKDIEHKTTSVDQEPEILQQTVSTAWVDGKHCLGLFSEATNLWRKFKRKKKTPIMLRPLFAGNLIS